MTTESASVGTSGASASEGTSTGVGAAGVGSGAAGVGPAAAAAAPTRRPTTYGALWRGVPRELGFLLPTLPVVLTALTVLLGLFWTGVGSVFLLIGVVLVVAALVAARGFGWFELLRLRAAVARPIPAPRWPSTQGGFWAAFFRPLASGHYWLYLLHGMIVNPIVGILTWTVAFAWTVTALATSTYWIYARALPLEPGELPAVDVIGRALVPGFESGLDTRTADSIFFAVVGAVLLITLPFVTRGLTLIHWWIARGMLARFRSDQLQQRVAEVSASRSAAVAAEGTALRRLERDIHDGPQQRLVRLQMDLAAAERQLDSDPERARALIAEAMQQSRDALEELRALSRGFAPPILLDRGLVAAVESLAVRSVVPTRVESELPPGLSLADEIERNAYFVAAEALTNVAKHAEATAAVVTLRVLTGTDGARWLELQVVDDGRGGAVALPEHGLAGLEERLRGVGGVAELSSPAGGPTRVRAVLPLAADAAPSTAVESG